MKRLTLILLAITLLAACKKKDKDTPGAYAKNVKSVNAIDVDGNVIWRSFYTYYGDGRVRTQREGYGNTVDDDVQTYTYDADKVTATGSATGAKTVYYLNSAGLADSVVAAEGYGGALQHVYTMKYDANGYCIERRHYSLFPSRYEYVIVDGNTTMERYFDGNGSLLHERSFTYDLNYENSLDPRNYGKPFLGKFSKNAMVSWTGGTAHINSYGMIDSIHQNGNDPYVIGEHTVYEYY